MRYSIEEIKTVVSDFARQYGAGRVYLFGSYARGDANADSNIDLRIDKGFIRGLALAGLAADLEEALGTSVNLISTASVDRNFLKSISADEILLYEPDITILEHIVKYCSQIEETIRRFGSRYSIFTNDAIYQNAAAMCVLQISELVGLLSDDFQDEHPGAPWRQIKSMRNIIIHGHGMIDPETTWEILIEDIPSLKAYCTTIMNESQE